MLKKSAFVASLCLALLSACTKKTSNTDNTIQVALTSNVKSLDPLAATDAYVNTVVGQVYETLLHYHYLKRPLQLEPQLAEALPEISKDGLTYTFKIKKGVKFHDDPAFPNGKGRELTAQDFIYSWKRLADPANQSEAFWVFDGKIKGLNEWREKIRKGEVNYDTPVEGLEAPDTHTLVIKLARPFYQLNYVLAMMPTAVVAKEAVEKYGKEFLNHMVGTGPFKFESWTRNSKVVLVKNPNFRVDKYPSEGEPGDKEKGFLNDAGANLPLVDKLVFNEIIEDQPRWLNFMKGDLDYVGIPKDSFDNAVKDNKLVPDLANKGVKLEINREPDVTYTAFNMDDPVVGKNLELRRAIALANDTNTLIQKFYNGRGIVAQSPIPPDIDGYDDNFKNPYKEFNVAKAKEHLAKAGYPEGKGLPTLEYATVNSSTSRQMAEFFQQNMEKIGIKVKISSSSWPQFTDKIREKKAQLYSIAWSADYPDAENFLQLLYGPNASPGTNGSNWKNKEFDELFKKASLTPPGPERTKMYQAMRDIFVKELPWVPMSHRLSYTVYYDWLKNFKNHSIIIDNYKYLRVDPARRAELKAKF